MTKQCPFTANQWGNLNECLERRCTMWSEEKQRCLFAMSLEKYSIGEELRKAQIEELQQSLQSLIGPR